MLLKVFFFVFCFLISEIPSVTYKDCTTPNGEKAKCVPLTSCPILITALASSQKTLMAFYRNSICENGTDPLVCCGTSGNYTSSTKNRQRPEGPRGVNKLELLPTDEICGLQHSDDYFENKEECLSLPVKDNTTLIHDFPWIALLLHKTSNGALTFGKCTGSLINDRYVITLESCTKSLKPVAVRLGDYNLFEDKDCAGEGYLQECSEPVLDVAVEKIINKHSDDDENSGGLALLRLNQTVVFTDYIRPICIKHYSHTGLNFGELILQSGWGADVLKKKSTAIILPSQNCACDGQSVDNYDDVWTLIVLATGNVACFDLFGGPAMHSENNRWHLVGVTKFGGRCGNRQKGLGVYVDVRNNLNWILSSIEP